MSKYAKVLLPVPLNKPFDYLLPDSLEVEIGDYVLAPFGKKEIWGVVESTSFKIAPKLEGKLKILKKIYEDENGEKLPPINQNLFKLIDWQSKYTMEGRGKVLGLCYNQNFFRDFKRKPKSFKKEAVNRALGNIQLSTEQQEACQNISSRIKAGKHSATLLDGVTGSGKTEVYFKLIEEVINSSKQVLLMFPEILLTAQITERFEKYFGFKPVIWHSSITEAARRAAFKSICKGDEKIIIGARSALHLPYKNLGLIIVDEEHDQSFKQEDGVVYHARDMAVLRSKIEDIPIILSSATPSIETYLNYKSGKYYREVLSQRFSKVEMPEIEVVDMREDKLPATKWISSKLQKELQDNLSSRKQSMLYLNRRGYAPLTLCGKCGHRLKSPDSSAWMVMHYNRKGEAYLECHHSGLKMPVPEKCPSCEAKDSFRVSGPGVQRIAEEVKTLFPEARVLEMASDNTATQGQVEEIIAKILNHEVDIIVGTQIIAKGHHFPALSLVGIIDGDFGMDVADLRSSERTFQILHQVSGRAGRESVKGKVMLQTFQPENKVIEFLKADDREGFFEHEMDFRKRAHYPPFSRFVGIIISSHREDLAANHAKQVTSLLHGNNKIKLLGPAKAIMYELRGQFRYRILMQADKDYNIQGYINSRLEKFKHPSTVKLKIDVDPVSFV